MSDDNNLIIIKERFGNVCVIRSQSYAESLEHSIKLYDEAKKDFPKLKKGDVRLVKYVDQSYDRTMGIEFRVPKDAVIPETYSKIPKLWPAY